MVEIKHPKGPFPLNVSVACPNEDCDGDFINYNIGYDKVHRTDHQIDCPACGAPIRFRIKMIPIAVEEEIVWTI